MKTVTFRIRPDKKGKWKRGGGYFDVWIFPTQKGVRNAYRNFNPRGQWRDVRAFCRRLNDGNLIGVIVYPRGTGAGVVAHEATHAAVDFVAWDLRRRDVPSMDVEPICQAVGNIVRELTVGFYKHGVWK